MGLEEGEDSGHQRNDGHRLGIGQTSLPRPRVVSSQTLPAAVRTDTYGQAGLRAQGQAGLGAKAMVADPQALEVKAPAPAHSPFAAVLLQILPSADWTETGCHHALRLVDNANGTANPTWQS